MRADNAELAASRLKQVNQPTKQPTKPPTTPLPKAMGRRWQAWWA